MIDSYAILLSTTNLVKLRDMAVVESPKILRRDPQIGVSHQRAKQTVFENIAVSRSSFAELGVAAVEVLATGNMASAVKRLSAPKLAERDRLFERQRLIDAPIGLHRNYQNLIRMKIERASPAVDYHSVCFLEEVSFGRTGVIEKFCEDLPHIRLPDGSPLYQRTIAEVVTILKGAFENGKLEERFADYLKIVLIIKCFDQAVAFCELIETMQGRPFGIEKRYTFPTVNVGTSYVAIVVAPAFEVGKMLEAAAQCPGSADSPQSAVQFLSDKGLVPDMFVDAAIGIMAAGQQAIPPSRRKQARTDRMRKNVMEDMGRFAAQTRKSFQDKGLMRQDFVEVTCGLSASLATAYVALEFIWAVRDAEPFIKAMIEGRDLPAPARHLGIPSANKGIVNKSNIGKIMQVLQARTGCRRYGSENAGAENTGREPIDSMISKISKLPSSIKLTRQATIDVARFLKGPPPTALNS
jgi:hypothetical protein